MFLNLLAIPGPRLAILVWFQTMQRTRLFRAATNNYFKNRLISRLFFSINRWIRIYKKTKKSSNIQPFIKKRSLVQIYSAKNLQNVHKKAHNVEKVINIRVDLMLFSDNLFEFCWKLYWKLKGCGNRPDFIRIIWYTRHC